MASLLLLVYASSSCIHARGDSESTGSLDTEYKLDLTHRSVELVIYPGIPAPETKQFVQIQVTQVINPRKIPLSFNVHYHPVEGEESFLGTFSLFPPDNPGKFIVATKGQLQTGGVIIVSLVPLEELRDLNELTVWFRISFIEE